MPATSAFAFQIADDILDAEGDEALVGKKLHKDGAAGKETFLAARQRTARGNSSTDARRPYDAHLKPYGPEADLAARHRALHAGTRPVTYSAVIATGGKDL